MAVDYTADLNYYFNNQVQMSDAKRKKSVDVAVPIIQQILQYVNKEDKRFRSQMECVGSYWQGLKVERADEFDVSVPLNYPVLSWTSGGAESGEYFEVDPNNKKELRRTTCPLPPPPVGYTRIGSATGGSSSREDDPQVSNPVRAQEAQYGRYWRDDGMKFDGVLIPMYFRRTFKNLLKEAVRQLNLRHDVNVSRKDSGPANTIYIKVRDHHQIDVDFAPVILCHLPFPSWIGWPRGAQWPSHDKIVKLKSIGMNLAPKRDIDWYYSFAEAEKELARDMDRDGGNRKKLHRIMKKLAHDVWCPEPRPVLNSYLLKNILFWECEKHPSASDWNNDQLWTRFLSMTREMRAAMTRGSLSCYFFPKVNLLEGRDQEKLRQVVDNIDTFLRNPSAFLRA